MYTLRFYCQDKIFLNILYQLNIEIFFNKNILFNYYIITPNSYFPYYKRLAMYEYGIHTFESLIVKTDLSIFYKITNNLLSNNLNFVSISLNKFQIQWKSAYLFDAKNAIFRPIP